MYIPLILFIGQRRFVVLYLSHFTLFIFMWFIGFKYKYNRNFVRF